MPPKVRGENMSREAIKLRHVPSPPKVSHHLPLCLLRGCFADSNSPDCPSPTDSLRFNAGERLAHHHSFPFLLFLIAEPKSTGKVAAVKLVLCKSSCANRLLVCDESPSARCATPKSPIAFPRRSAQPKERQVTPWQQTCTQTPRISNTPKFESAVSDWLRTLAKPLTSADVMPLRGGKQKESRLVGYHKKRTWVSMFYKPFAHQLRSVKWVSVGLICTSFQILSKPCWPKRFLICREKV